jgi:hypothetical protein
MEWLVQAMNAKADLFATAGSVDNPAPAADLNAGTLAGSYAIVARSMNGIARLCRGVKGAMSRFDNFTGTSHLGYTIAPSIRSRP